MGLLSRLFNREEKTIVEMPTNYSNASSIFKVQDVFTINKMGTIVAGKVISGEFNINDIVYVNNKQTKIIGIEMFRKTTNKCVANENAGLLLENIKHSDVSS